MKDEGGGMKDEGPLPTQKAGLGNTFILHPSAFILVLLHPQ